MSRQLRPDLALMDELRHRASHNIAEILDIGLAIRAAFPEEWL